MVAGVEHAVVVAVEIKDDTLEHRPGVHNPAGGERDGAAARHGRGVGGDRGDRRSGGEQGTVFEGFQAGPGHARRTVATIRSLNNLPVPSEPLAEPRECLRHDRNSLLVPSSRKLQGDSGTGPKQIAPPFLASRPASTHRALCRNLYVKSPSICAVAGGLLTLLLFITTAKNVAAPRSVLFAAG